MSTGSTLDARCPGRVNTRSTGPPTEAAKDRPIIALGILGLIFIMQGFHVLTLLALPGPARLLAPLPGRCHPWILASLHVLWLHEPTPYAPQTSHFVRVCLPVIQTSLRSANTTSYLTGKRSWRHQDHVCPLLCASGDPSRWSHGRFSARSLDVRWAEGCCAGSRPCHLEWGAISQARACSALPEEPRRASRCRAWFC